MSVIIVFVVLTLDLKALKEESEILIEVEEEDHCEKYHDFKTGEKSFKCTQTKKTSSRKRAQKTGTRSYFTCQQCGRSFTEKGSLQVHMRIHNGETPFTCKLCGKSFSQEGNRKTHMKIHTGEKPFTCPQCGKSFRHNVSLKNHRRVHTERPLTPANCVEGASH